MPPQKLQKRAPPCAFCINPRNSREHHWPKWLDEIFPPRTSKDHNIKFNVFVESANGKTYALNPLIKIKQGSARSISKKSVCIACNGGWMSVIQNQAKPILTELIQNTKKTLTFEEQMVICPWIVMTDMTAEYDHPPTMTTTTHQRHLFKKERLPPEGWLIFIGRYKGTEWNTRFRHKAYKTNLHIPFDIHTTLFVVGEFFFSVFAVDKTTFSPMDEFLAEFVRVFPLVRIWPPTSQDVIWERLPYLLDIDAYDLSDFLSLNMPKPLFKYNPYNWV